MKLNSVTESTRETAHLFLEKMMSGDTSGLLDLFHDDATWHLLGDSALLPLARVYRKDEIRSFIQSIGALITTHHGTSVDGVMADGPHAAIEIHPTGESATGKPYDNRALYVLHIEDRKVLSLKEYLDTGHLRHIMNS